MTTARKSPVRKPPARKPRVAYRVCPACEASLVPAADGTLPPHTFLRKPCPEGKAAGPLAYLRATKTKANKQTHLPDMLVMTLDGLSGARGALDLVGWCMGELTIDEQVWPVERIAQYRKALCDEFRRLWGRSWTFDVCWHPPVAS